MRGNMICSYLWEILNFCTILVPSANQIWILVMGSRLFSTTVGFLFSISSTFLFALEIILGVALEKKLRRHLLFKITSTVSLVTLDQQCVCACNASFWIEDLGLVPRGNIRSVRHRPLTSVQPICGPSWLGWPLNPPYWWQWWQTMHHKKVGVPREDSGPLPHFIDPLR